MFKKQALIWLSVLLFVCLVATVAGCKPDEPKPTPAEYTVTYDKGNAAATGTAPQAKKYAADSTVTVEANPFELTDYEFLGWKVDGSDALYKAGDTFTMPQNDLTLTAQWKRVAYQGNKFVTVADVLKEIPDENTSSDIECKQYIYVKVVSIEKADYGQMIVEDDTGSISVYGTRGSDGETYYDKLEVKPVADDVVVLYIQTLANYKGTKEIKIAWIMDVEKPAAPTFDVKDYSAKNISEARSEKTGAKVLVEGVVARITYANGMKPSGFFLVDGTDSIYVYDSQIALQVAQGDKIKVAGERDNWILETEQSAAEKFGYTGCIQLASAHLVEKTASNQGPDFGWVQESTVKKIMDTPVTENITTTIFKVNALVKKAPGSGFVNYYFDDLDGETGSYTYTQCNGSDFGWLDEFDGKICTVYLSVINAKSSATGCVWRFVPIAVEDEQFKFDEKNALRFALDYYGVEQFEAEYNADPSLEVVTEVTSDLLGLGKITLSYASNNEASVKFATEDGKTVMHTLAAGKATVTVTAEYKSYKDSAEVEIVVGDKPSYQAVTVAQAIAAELETDVTVKGVVGPSLVNKDGFYLIDDTGVIAVLTKTKEDCKELSLGNEVTIKAKRTVFSGDKGFGQTCLKDAEILLNEYGAHEYSKKSFIEGKTLKDLYDTDAKEDHTTEVYIVKGTVEFIREQRYSKLSLKDGDTTFELYCSSAEQYSFLEQFNGQEITMEIALCNWNNKAFYKGCVLSATASDGTTVYNQLNLKQS